MSKVLEKSIFFSISKVRKASMIRNQYNQVQHLTKNTTWESDTNTTMSVFLRPRGDVSTQALLCLTKSLPYHFHHILSILKFTLATCTLFLTGKFTHQSLITNVHFFPYPLFFGTGYQLIPSYRVRIGLKSTCRFRGLP